jgi:ribonuclease E
MEETRHQRQVEHKVKDAMRNDRARIQIGRISAFGLLEMSRQRLRPSLLEHSTEICPHCAGTGRIRSIESAALHALRAIEEEGVRRRAGEIMVSVPPTVALYLLNQKRHTLSEIEKRYGFAVSVEADDELHAADCEIERVRGHRGDRDRPAQELARASYEEVSGEARPMADELDGPDIREPGEAMGERVDGRVGERGEDEDGSRRRRRRRRRRPRRDGESEGDGADRPQAAAGEGYPADEPAHDHAPNGAATDEPDDRDGESPDEPREGPREGETVHAEGDRNGDGNRRRRGRRGGRRRRRENGEDAPGDRPPREHGYSEQREEYRAAEPNGEDSHDAPSPDAKSYDEGAPAPAPMDQMPVEHAPYDPGPPVNVEAAPPPPPVVAAAPQPEPPPPPAVVPVIPVLEAPPEKPKRGWWRR